MNEKGLVVVKPIVVAPLMMLSSNVEENDHPQWLAETSYASGSMVIDEHFIYESIEASNTGNKPKDSPEKWRPKGPTNRWMLFDESINSQTKNPTLISYVLKTGVAINYLALLNLSGATSVRVRVTHPTYGMVYDKTISVKRTPVASGWWAWWFGDRTEQTQVLFQDIPAVPGTSIMIDVEGGEKLAIGVALLGVKREFAVGVKRGAGVGIIDSSRKDRNDWGDIVVVQRAFASRSRLSLLLNSKEVDSMKAFLAGCRATPCLWIGSSKYESTTIYGFYKSFDIVISYLNYSDCDIELESFT